MHTSLNQTKRLKLAHVSFVCWFGWFFLFLSFSPAELTITDYYYYYYYIISSEAQVLFGLGRIMTPMT
jgi:hypothetical protein